MKRMLFNATQQEERRLAIVDGQKLIDFDTEIEGREQRKGNIYKGVVTRIEPSLEACFVNYGEDRHGFLPFKEISRQYFRDGVDVRTARIQDAITEGQEADRPGREGRARQQGRGPDHLHLAGRPLPGADAEQPARRRRVAPHRGRGPRGTAKDALDQLECPKGMSMIARTAGIGRTAAELQWDLNYLLQAVDRHRRRRQGGKGAFLIYQESSPGHPRDPRLLHSRHRRDPDRHRRHLRTGPAVHGAT